MERLRSRRSLSKDMRNKLRRALQTLPPRSSEFPRSLKLQTTDGIDEVVLGLKSSHGFVSLIVLSKHLFVADCAGFFLLSVSMWEDEATQNQNAATSSTRPQGGQNKIGKRMSQKYVKESPKSKESGPKSENQSEAKVPRHQPQAQTEASEARKLSAN
jgi:hypothetical protein